MNIYEDEEDDRDKSVLGFLKQNKQLVWMAGAFVFAYAFMSFSSRQLDAAVASQQADSAQQHLQANPWSKDR